MSGTAPQFIPGTDRVLQVAKPTSAVLGLDLGTLTGWALRSSAGVISSGTESFRPKSSEGYGGRFMRFRRFLSHLKGEGAIDLVIYEDVKHHGPGQVYAAHVYGGLEAFVCAWCEHRSIAYRKVGVAQIKKFWTGKGNARKPAMIEAAKVRGFSPADDNEADALAVLHYCIEGGSA